MGRPRRGHRKSSSGGAPESKDFDPDRLSIVVEGQAKSFSQWTLDYAQHYYPEAGTKTYRVPPVDFNTQPLTDDHQLGLSHLGQPKEETRKKDRSQANVGNILESLGHHLESSGGHGLFIVASAQYDNYLNDLKWLKVGKGKQPPLPRDVATRGELDFLVLHRDVGIVLIQVKGVGFADSWKATKNQRQEAVQRKVKEAMDQLERDDRVLQHILKDLQLTCTVHKVVALPFVSREYLEKIVAASPSADQGACKDLATNPRFLYMDDISTGKAMLSWWEGFGVGSDDTTLTEIQLKHIVGRYCGLMSTVSVWCKSSLRVEVRDVAEAVEEVGTRFSNIVLTTEQRDALDCPDHCVFLYGPPGSGKSVMLVVKARKWLLDGYDVCILNPDFGRMGMPVGHYIHDSITQWLDNTFGASSDSSECSSCCLTESEKDKAKANLQGSTLNKMSRSSSSEADDGMQSNIKQSSSEDLLAARRSEIISPDIRETLNISTDSKGGTPSQIKTVQLNSPSDNGVLSSHLFKHPTSATAESCPPSCNNRTAVTAEQVLKSSPDLSAQVRHSNSFSSVGSNSEADSLMEPEVGRVFRVDFDMEMKFNGEEDTYGRLMQDIKNTIRPGVPCHFLWDEFYWKDRLTPALKALRAEFPSSFAWCAEVSGSNIPEGFTPIMLTTVLRCPPAVQAVLRETDPQDENKHLYMDDSTFYGLPTDGFKPRLIEHMYHMYNTTSPLNCIQCADNILEFFYQVLKLRFGESSQQMDDQGNSSLHQSSIAAAAGNIQPSNILDSKCQGKDTGQSAASQEKDAEAASLGDVDDRGAGHRNKNKPSKSPPIPRRKNKRNVCHPRRIKFSDIAVVFSYPQSCLNRDSSLLIVKAKPEDEHHCNIENSVFYQRMKAAGLPAVFLAPKADAREIALPAEDRVLFSVTNAITGLERKVVVYVPCESTAYSYPVEQPVQVNSDKTSDQITATQENVRMSRNSVEPKPDSTSKQQRTVPASEIPENLNTLTGVSNASKKPKLEGKPTEPKKIPLHYDMASSYAEKGAPNSNNHTVHHQNTCASDPAASSTSLSPSASLSPADWAKIKERLLEQNQKGVFYAASRCLSMFVLIIP